MQGKDVHHRGNGTQPMHWEAVRPDIPAIHSLAREFVGIPQEREWSDDVVDVEPPRPATMLELDRYDKIVSLGHVEEPTRRRPLSKCRHEHLMVTKWLDRFGCMSTEQLRRAVMPWATLRATQDLLRRMRDAGLVERRRPLLDLGPERGRGGSATRMYALTTAGYRLGQKSPGFYRSVIPRTEGRRRSEAQRPMRLRHDLHVIGWWQAFEAAIGSQVGVADALTPRYDEGRLQPPRIHMARGYGSRPVELRDVILRDGYTFMGIADEPFEYVLQPDLTLQLELLDWRRGSARFVNVDLLVEVDRTQSPAHNRRKFQRYDAFLTGWGLLHPRVEQIGTRPVVIFTSPDADSMFALMRAADRVMTGRIGLLGDPEHAWYYAGREHILFTIEDEIHHGSLRAWKLPELPYAVRVALCDESFPRNIVDILPPEFAREA